MLKAIVVLVGIVRSQGEPVRAIQVSPVSWEVDVVKVDPDSAIQEKKTFQVSADKEAKIPLEGTKKWACAVQPQQRFEDAGRLTSMGRLLLCSGDGWATWFGTSAIATFSDSGIIPAFAVVTLSELSNGKSASQRHLTLTLRPSQP